MESVSLTYAQALLLLSLEDDNSKEVLDQTEEISKIIASNKDFIRMFDSKVITKENKKEIISNIFEKQFNHDLVNFMKLLVDKSRIQYLKRICDEYKKLYLEHYQIKEAKIYSANKLSQANIDEIKESLEKKYNSTFIVDTFIDKDLIAGVKIVIGDLVIDGTIKNKFKKMKASIAV